MKKVLLALLGVVALLVVALFVGPSLIDWKPRIASAVHTATGRDLRIDGDLHIAVLPKVRVAATGVSLSNAVGAAKPEMLTVESVAVEVELWPLLGKRLVIDSLVVKKPSVNLEVDKAGRPNWVFSPPGEAEVAVVREKPETKAGAPLAGVQLGDVRIEDGQLFYRNAMTGQTLDAKNVTLSAAMAELTSPLSLKGQMTLNDEPITADLSIDSLDRLSQGQQAKVKFAVDTKHLNAHFDGSGQQQPVPGLNGAFDLDISSVGRLLAWLQQPLDKSQPDPGPLKVHAEFITEGAKSILREATITGAALNAKASGSVDASGPVAKVSATLETNVLDIDRYLPPQAKEKRQPGAQGPAPAGSKDVLAGISDQPFDLSALRKADADIKISIAGIKAMGYEIGRIAFATLVKGGVATAELKELGLYGGNVTGTVKVDASGNTLGLDAAMKVDRVTLDKLAQQAPGAPPVSGVVSATLDAKAQGKSPRALAEDLQGHLAVDLGGAKAAAAQAISELKLDVAVPGPNQPPSLRGSLIYNGERVEANATAAPLAKLLSGDRSPVTLAVDSKVVTLHYGGSVQQRPIPGLDGTFDLDVPSVGKLATWVGQPLDAKQPDPGPLKVHAVLASDGAKLALKDATIAGKAIKATAQAKFDASEKVASFDVKVDIEQADLNAYLPPPTDKVAAAKPAQPQPTGWSTEPFKMEALGDANGQADVQLAAIRYRDLDITKGHIGLVLTNRVLKLTTENLALAQGTINSGATLDAASAVPKFDYHASVAGVQARPLLKTFAGSDRLGGTIQFEATGKGSGRNQKELVQSLDGTGRFNIADGAIYGINLAAALRKVGSLGFGDSQTEKTDFAELSGTYTIKDGILENRDMKLLAPLFRVTGSGTVPMPPQTIDYTAEAKLVPTIEGQGGRDALAGLPIPIKITGPWSSPSYQVDWANVFHEMAADPERLKNLPANLSQAAKSFGVGLPIPEGTGSSLPQELLKSVPGLPKAATPGGEAAPGGAQTKPPASNPLQRLFGK